MKAPLPRKWSNRVFAVYLVATIFGGVILFLFIVLLGLMYWMNAPVQLPDPDRLVPTDKAAAWLFVRATDFSKLPPGLSEFVTGGAPDQVVRLIQHGNSAAAGPVLFTACLLPGKNAPSLTFSVSLHRGPGQFRMVRRDLERRLEKHSLPMSVRYYQGKAIFLDADPPKPLPALCLSHCTMIRGSDPDALQHPIEGVDAPPESQALQWAAEPHPMADFRGSAKGWQSIPLRGLLSTADEAKWERFSSDFASAFPELCHSDRGIEFGGEFGSPTTAELWFNFKAAQAEAAQTLADAIPPWLAEHGPDIGLSEPIAKCDKDVVRLTLTARF